MTPPIHAFLAFLSLALVMLSCGSDGSAPSGPGMRDVTPAAGASSCQLVPSGDAGPVGQTAIHAQAIVTGLDTPWDLAFLPGGDWLVTERPGRLRLVKNGQLAGNPVATVSTVQSGEGGLLGIALDPSFASNSTFYMYYTANPDSTPVNRVQKFTLSADHASATPGPVILDNLVWNSVHNGGRIKFGPDGKLYVSVGEGADAAAPENSATPNGKILRINSDGSIPSDNPDSGNPWYLKGLRNPQAFDWWNASTLIVSDNGPTGEYQGRTGGDKLLVMQKGSDAGWPTIWHCETQAGLVTPILTWTDAVPPNGLIVYHGSEIPGWDGSILIGSTGAEQLHRVVLSSDGSVKAHEMYLTGSQSLGRLRTVIQGPDGALYVTTSNCDGRGSCPSQQDGIYRISPGSP